MEIKVVETVRVVPQRAGSWTKKPDNPIHFRWTASLIAHHSEQKLCEKWCITSPSTHLMWYESKMENNYKYPSEPKMNPGCLLSFMHVLYACLSVSRLHMWELLHVVSNAYPTDAYFPSDRYLRCCSLKEGRDAEEDNERCLRWMSMVTLVSLPLGTALLEALQMICWPVSMMEGDR